jgi:hypothetical protein
VLSLGNIPPSVVLLLSLPQIQLLTTKREGERERKGRETLLLAGSSFVQVKVYLISKEEEEPRCRFY